VAAQVVLTDEAIAALSDEGVRLLGQELKASVAVGGDAAFLTALSGNSSEAMGQDTYAGICDDIEELLRTLNIGVGSRVFIIMTPTDTKSLAVRAMANGVTTLSYQGGSFAGAEILPSDAQTAHRITAVDATGLAIVLGDLELRSSGEALVEMVDSSAQTSGPNVNAVQAVSMFQTNSKCLLVERSLAVKPIRTACFAHLTGVALGQGSDSPLQG
jgi:hypothetical protein